MTNSGLCRHCGRTASSLPTTGRTVADAVKWCLGIECNTDSCMITTYMALLNHDRLRNVQGLSEAHKSSIQAFVQGALHTWIQNHRESVFAVHDLAGGSKWNWRTPPLSFLFQKHFTGNNAAFAMTRAAIDLGWLVKSVLAADPKSFLVTRKGRVIAYSWRGGDLSASPEHGSLPSPASLGL